MANAEPTSPFHPPFTTLHAGTIEGGTAGNITAKRCEFLTDIRVAPPETPAEWFERYKARVKDVEAEIQAIHPEARIEVVKRMMNPPCRQEDQGAAEELARALTGDNSQNVVSYGTEAGQFQDGGYSTCICGPGDIAQALRIAGPNLTFHLSHMRQAGLVSSRRAGRNVIYAADFGRMTALIDYLQENCCEGVAPRRNRQKEPA